MVFKTALIHGVAPVYLNDLCISATATCCRQNLRYAFCRTLLVLHVDCGRAATFCCQWTDHLEQSLDCTTSTRASTERLHTCTEEAPALDCPAPLRHFYTIPVLITNALTGLLTYLITSFIGRASVKFQSKNWLVPGLQQVMPDWQYRRW